MRRVSIRQSGLLAVALATELASAALGSGTAFALPTINHVFIIVLENKGFSETFGTNSPAPYLAGTLVNQGALLSQYYGIGHLSLDNYVAMISGQAPNLHTQTDCQIYSDFVGVPDPLTGGPLIDVLFGQAIGQGCVYPAAVKTIVDQLEAKGSLDWKGYMEDMGISPTRDSTDNGACGHPVLNTQDKTQSATQTDQYAARHNPFVYFHSIIDDQPRCDAHVVSLDALAADLSTTDASHTPNYVFITPDLCHDAHDATCADGGPGGLVAADLFLQTWVPKILDSAAFKQDGLLIVTFDEAETDPREASPTELDASSCCDELPGFNTVLPGIGGPGGGRTGAVLLSKFIASCTKSDVGYNHYSLLRSIEDLFDVGHLGFAAQRDGVAPLGAVSFGDDVYTNPNGSTTFTTVPSCSN